MNKNTDKISKNNKKYTILWLEWLLLGEFFSILAKSTFTFLWFTMLGDIKSTKKCTFLMVLNVSYQGEIVFRKKYVYWIYLADTNNLSQKTEYFPFLTKTWKKSAFWWSYTVRRYSFFVFFRFLWFWVCVVEGICLFSTSKILTLRAVMDTEPIQRGSKFAKNQLPIIVLNLGGFLFLAI